MLFLYTNNNPIVFFRMKNYRIHVGIKKNKENLCINIYEKYYITKKWPCLNMARYTACISVIEPTLHLQFS